jgi:filamentous hemagglutinin
VSPLGVLVHNKANAHRFFKQRNDLVAAIDAAVKAIDQMRGETTTTGELGKVDVTKRTDLAERLSKARDQLENTKASTKDLTLKDEDLLDLAKSEHSKASDEVATLQRDVAEAKKPFQQRMNELADGVSTLETRRADAATENDKMLADAEAAKTSAGDDKGQLEEATKQRAAALARKKTLEKTRQRIEAVKRDSNTISEDPSSDSGITAQKDRLNAAEIELANLEGEMSQGGHMLGSKGPQITSKTLWESDDGVQHVDIENPNPGQRPGQIHYQPDAYSKWYYDPHLKKLYNQKEKTLAPPSVQARLKDPEIAAAIEEGLRQLGETK